MRQFGFSVRLTICRRMLQFASFKAISQQSQDPTVSVANAVQNAVGCGEAIAPTASGNINFPELVSFCQLTVSMPKLLQGTGKC